MCIYIYIYIYYVYREGLLLQQSALGLVLHLADGGAVGLRGAIRSVSEISSCFFWAEILAH